MSREWKPGDVAMVTVEGFKPEVAVFTESGRWHDASDMSLDDRSPDSTYRSLVVIDPEDREAVERLAHLLQDFDSHLTAAWVSLALREYASPKPPRPDEPQGLGAVVEDGSGFTYTRFSHTEAHNEGSWINEDGLVVQWSSITAVRVLSPGVEVDQ